MTQFGRNGPHVIHYNRKFNPIQMTQFGRNGPHVIQYSRKLNPVRMTQFGGKGPHVVGAGSGGHACFGSKALTPSRQSDDSSVLLSRQCSLSLPKRRRIIRDQYWSTRVRKRGAGVGRGVGGYVVGVGGGICYS